MGNFDFLGGELRRFMRPSQYEILHFLKSVLICFGLGLCLYSMHGHILKLSEQAGDQLFVLGGVIGYHHFFLSTHIYYIFHFMNLHALITNRC